MSCENRPAPNVWICLNKIRAYINEEYTDRADVLCCLESLERMFAYVPKGQSEGCSNGFENDLGENA